MVKKLSGTQNPQQTLARLLTNHRVNRGLCFSIIFALFWLISWTRMDLDFGWHLASGRYFLAHGIPQHDIFSYTAPNFPWVDHEWAADIMLSVVYNLGGYGLLSVLYGLLWSGAIIIAGWRARAITLLIATDALLPYAGIRAIAWTVLLMAIVLRILQSEQQRLRWCLPLLFMVWANLHAGFIVGLAVIAWFALQERKRPLVYILALSGIATLANAYGPQVYVEIARTIFDSSLHTQITEWRWFGIDRLSLSYVVLWAAGMVLFVGWNPVRWFRLSSLLLLSAISASRNLPLFVIASLSELDYFLRQARLAIPKRLDAPRKLALFIMVGSIVSVLVQTGYSNFHPLPQREDQYPAQAVLYLQAHGCDKGHLFNSYNYGGYLDWKLPSEPVYIDGRMPTWPDANGETRMAHYLKLARGQISYKTEFKRYDIRCAIIRKVSNNLVLITQLQKDHWKVAVQTGYSVLLLAPEK